MLCDCSVTEVGGERLPSPSINNVVVSPAFPHLLLFSVVCFSSLPLASTMGKDGDSGGSRGGSDSGGSSRGSNRGGSGSGSNRANG
jgi:hypothetical protein